MVQRSTRRPDGRRPRVVIAHDFMETYGGAERVTEEIARAFPDAPVVALLGRRSVARRMGVVDRFRSLLPEQQTLLRRYRLLAPLYPSLCALARLPEADVLVSSSYAFAHRLRTRNGAPQVCFCHSPLRFAWTMTRDYRSEWAGSGVTAGAFELLARVMRRGDRRAARSVERYLTQSPFTARQIESFYGRPAEVIGVPIDTGRFQPAPAGGERGYFLVCGRLVEPYKRVSLAVEAFRGLPDERLVIAGDGPALPRLREVAPANVEFLGHLDDADLIPLMQRCRAAIFPSRDDFGLLPLEVMACGRPVLAYRAGGALHTVVPGKTGELFAEQTVAAIRAAVASFSSDRYREESIRAHAEGWSSERFRARLVGAVEAVANSAS